VKLDVNWLTYYRMTRLTGWRRLIGSPKLQIIFHKRATKYRSLLRNMTYRDKGSYDWPIYYRMARLKTFMGWLRLVGSLKLQVTFGEYHLFYRALLQKRPVILRSLQVVATPYHVLLDLKWLEHLPCENRL